MTIQTAKRLNHFPEYIFVRLNKLVKEVEKESGKKVMRFGAGSPDIKPSKRYITKLGKFIQEDTSHLYPGYGAIPELADGLIRWHKKRFNVELTAQELYPLNGGKDAMGTIPLAFLNQGDEVLVPDPGYPGFTEPALMIGAKIVPYNLLEKNKFKPDLKELETKISKKTKFIWVNFPSNPIGQVATIDELKPIVTFAKKHNIFIVYDNAYSEITFDDFIAPSILQIPEAKDIAIEIGSFSKSFSLAGFRMGWIVGNKDIIATVAKVKSQIDSGLSRPLQKLGAYALTNQDETWHTEMIKNYQKRREIIAGYLKELGLQFTLPKGALYIWAKIPETEKSSEDYCLQLLKQKKILLTPGSAFGKNGERYVRVSICVNIEGIEKYF